MMRPSTLALRLALRLALLAALPVAVLSPAATASAPAPALQQTSDLRGLLERRLTQVAQAPADEIWSAAVALRALARELDSDDLDSEVERYLKSSEALPDGSKLLAVAVRLQGADPDAPMLLGMLRGVLDAPREDLARGAAALLGDDQFRTLGSDERDELRTLLTKVMEDANRSPELRLEAGNSLFRQGGGADKVKARRQMKAFLESSDGELRAKGALALARTGSQITGELYDELRRLSILPGERGMLASSYLEQERVREKAQRDLKRQAELFASTAEERAATLEEGDDLQRLNDLIFMIERAHLTGDKAPREQLIEAALDGMLGSLDRHSSYLSPEAYKKFEQDLEAAYGGIGAYVGEDREDGLFTITHPIYSGPAYKAGLLSEDKIVRIGDWPTLGETEEDIIKRLKGQPGTPVKLYVWRRGMDTGLIERPSEEMAVVIERDTITIPTVQHQMLPGKIGMVVLRDFSRVASPELRGPLQEMLDAGMRGLILDLRNNPGGLLDEAVNVADLFLPKGLRVVSTESRVRETEHLETSRPALVPAEIPMVVLVNRFSASASEIVSGALQDHDRAVIVGQRSFGKGSVQNLLRMYGFEDDKYDDENRNGRWDNWEKITTDWNENGEFDYAPRIKLTIARYLLPSGRSIHHELGPDRTILSEGGVEPEVEVGPRKVDAWRIQEMLELRNQHVPRDYVDRNWAENKQLFGQIADNDRKDTRLYPGFDELYKSLGTPLPADDLRQLLRFEIRRRVQDARGQEFPQGDFVEDLQLQEGIRVVLKALDDAPEAYEDYRSSIPPEVFARGALASGDPEVIRDALDKIERAMKGDGRLSDDELQRLRDLLKRSLDK